MEVALSLSQGKRLTSVVVPAIVASDKGVSEILSRMPSLSAALANTDQALAFYSRNDPQSRPLYGTRAPASQLLLRVNKRSGTVSVEGLVEARWTFDMLADYQLQTAVKRPKLALQDDVLAFAQDFEGPVFPPVWAQQPHPQEFQFETVKKKRRSGADGAGMSKPWKIAFADDPPIVVPGYATREGDAATLACLSRLFLSVRPILGIEKLLVLLAKEGFRPVIKTLKKLLPSVAFTYKNGPFFRLWIRYGYNVKKEPMSRIFQAYIYRTSGITRPVEDVIVPASAPKLRGKKKKASVVLPSQEIQEADSVKERVLDLDDLERQLAMQAPITTWGLCAQLCDLAFEPVRTLVFKSVPSKECTVENGWFDEETLNKIRSAILERKPKLEDAKKEALWPCPDMHELESSKLMAVFEKRNIGNC